jgi:uncharacterized delta-60 repeat protein
VQAAINSPPPALAATAVLFTLLAGLHSQPASAQTPEPDGLDPEPNGPVYSLAVQADGKILLGGAFTEFFQADQARSSIARLNADGTLDSQFDPAANDLVYALAVQPDGKILVGGQFSTLCGQPYSYLGRLTADGTLDSAFDPGADGDVYVVAVQPDGKILVGGGFATLDGQSCGNLGRLNPDGTLDTGFAPGVDSLVESLALQPDGKIVVGGDFALVDGQMCNYLARFNPDGTLDTGFNPQPDNVVTLLAVQADGKILAGGSFANLGGGSCNFLGRLNPDGTLDTGFNSGTDGPVLALAVQADGEILVGGGFTLLGGEGCTNLGRLEADGTLDSAFNPQPSDQVYALGLQADGKILVGGVFARLGGQLLPYVGRLTNTEPATQSLSLDGSTATWVEGGAGPGFGCTAFFLSTNGTDWTLQGLGTWSSQGWQLSGVSLPPNGTLLARGYVGGGYGDGSSWSVVDYYGSPVVVSEPAGVTNPAGTTATFSVLASGSGPMSCQWLLNGAPLANGGNVAGTENSELTLTDVVHSNDGGYSVIVSNRFGSATSAVATLTVTEPAIAVQPASQNAQPGQGATLTVTPAGTPPFTFGWWQNGTALAGATASTLVVDNLTAADAGDYWVVVSNQYGSVTSAVAVLSVNLAVLDLAFNPGAGSANLYALAEQPDGKILLGGFFTSLGGQPRYGLGRLKADGTLDPAFNPGASVGQSGPVNSLALQPDGKILVGGSFTALAGQSCTGLGRLNADGTLDGQFNVGVGSESSNASPTIYAVAVQADGKILVGGYFSTLAGQPRNCLGRLNADGTLDDSFNPNVNSLVSSILVQGDGQILVGGDFGIVDGQIIYSVARLNPDGTLDSTFNPGTTVFGGTTSLGLQADGKVLVGTVFALAVGQSSSHLIRLNPDGTLDQGFNPQADNWVEALAVQADGKILAGGWFSHLGGQARSYLGRLNPDGTADPLFDPGADMWVQALAIQADGRILAGGLFANLDGQTCNHLGRLINTEPATQSLDYDGSTVTWLRGGASPEVWLTDFEVSTDGTHLTSLGEGSRVPGGWQLANVSLPPNASLLARGYVAGGYQGDSSWLLEAGYGAPCFIAPPAGQTNNATTTATFSTVVGGSEPFAFQWLKNGAPLADGGNVSGSQTAGLALATVLHADAAGYSVAVSNAFGSVTSAVAALTVLDPEIAVQPVSQSVQPGQQATFKVGPAGSAPFGFQWWKDGATLAGDTQATLTLTGLEAANAGDYWVVVSGPYGSVTSAVAELTVNEITADSSFKWTSTSSASCLAVQPDGKILAGGFFWLSRLNTDGTLDPGYGAQVEGGYATVNSLAIQPDGKVLAGGSFVLLDGQTSAALGRLNPDGTLDAQFVVTGTPAEVNSLVVQADGSILVGGRFNGLNGQPCSDLVRLNPDGSVDSQFTPGLNPPVFALAVQADGKILVGGGLDLLYGPVNVNGALARFNPDGTLDSGFNPQANGSVLSLAVQADGKILVGGEFSFLAGQPCNNLGRLNAGGTLDTQFNAQPNGEVYSLALQADGKILVGGGFNTVSGQSRTGLARLNADGTLDCEFAPRLNGQEFSVAVQADGQILLSCPVARLHNTEPATQTLSFDGSAITWLRGGASPEVWCAGFDGSTNGTDWTPLGAASRIPGGWQLTGVSLPPAAPIRARGYVTGGGNSSGSSWFVETVLPPGGLTPPEIITDDGQFGFGPYGFGFTVSGTPGQVLAVDGSTNLRNWLPLQTNTLSGAQFYFRDPNAAAKPRQFYRARIVP